MKKIIFAAIIVLAYSTLAFSGTAQWTGNQIPVPASTGYTVKCEYAQGNLRFWRLTKGACLPTVEKSGGGVPPTGTKFNPVKRIPAPKTLP